MGIRVQSNQLRRAGLVALCLFAPDAVLAEVCQENAVKLRGDWGQARFSVEIADTEQERARGLMFVQDMPASSGMLFLYDRPQVLSFWMHNTFIELDMLFVDPAGVVRHIHDRAQPQDRTPITGGNGMIAVLEINGGLSEQLGITEGSEILHPAFGADAAWACEDAQ